MTRSLRTRLLAGIIGGMALLLTVFSLLIYVVIRSALVRQFDTSLASVAQVLAASVEIDANGIDVEFGIQEMPQFTDPDHTVNYQIWKLDGEVIARSPLLGTDDLPCFHGPPDKLLYKALPGPENHPHRAVGTTFFPRIETEDPNSAVQTAEQPLTMVVARDASRLYDQLDLLKWLLFCAGGLNAGLALIIGFYVVRRGLLPLNTIAAEIAAIRVESLTTRIDAEHIPIEILPIKNRLNELMSRLEASFNKERQLNADVAHELRTPLAGIRSTIEVTLARRRDASEYQEALSSCLEISKNMQLMVSNLLTLARLDARQISSHTERIQIAELVNCCWRPFSDKALNDRITFNNQIEPDLTCESDRRNLSIVLSNILENAAEYAHEGGRIWSTARQTDDSVEIEVSNTGCQLTAGQVSQVFDVFWRGDSSRSAAGVHCGLGLTLVQRLTRALGGCAVAKLQPAGTFTIQLTLPLKP